MPIVTLTTDFGQADIYAGRFKGRLLSAVENLNIIDVTHEIPPFDLIQGAYSLKYTFGSFPTGTYHIIRVNEQGLENGGLLAARGKGHFFLAQDNGLLPMALNNQFEWINRIDLDKFSDIGSDEVFAMVLKRMVEDEIEEISIPAIDYKVNTEWAIIKEENSLRGMVVLIDYFGNLITNIHISDVMSYMNKYSRFVVYYRTGESVDTIVANYSDVPKGASLCRVNELGFLEIATNQGEATKLLGVKFGQPVQIKFDDN